ncbi:ribokinase [Curtobacterium sp. Leaf261]|uniref:ribokinase n=1 Tax=Curtobacterium sp. Leaf261 TaxID=1736311 RepID=UPI0006FAEAF7|nr:ribokinase [Curtobacterium sp. Leaf261]KQO61243.1 carbohydrate kinase [Curtobacterium sp. Leaf261]
MTAPAQDHGRIVVVGSLNADLVVRTDRFPKAGETLRGEDLAILPGGKSANQAVAAGRLGGSVAIVGAVGADGNGTMLLDSVRDAGVDVRAVRVLDDVATGTAVITVDADGENTIVISAGANGRLTPADVDAADEVFAGASVLGLCLEVDVDVVLEAARRAHDAGVTVLTNLSPFGEVPPELLRHTDVLLVNEHEAAQLVDSSGERDWRALAGLLAERGVHRTIVTTGGAGCVVLDGDAAPETVASVRVDAVDTTGCGDAFMGAVALRLADGDALVDAARFAVGVGAFAATRPGAQASYPTRSELEEFLAAR